MTQNPRQIDTSDAALDGDERLRRVRAFRRMAERGLIHGDANERALAVDMIEYLITGAVGGLDAALGLTGPGWSGALTRYRIECRAADLRRIWRTFWPDLSAKAAARMMAQKWRRYETGAWPRHRDAGTEPADALDAALHRLLIAGHKPREAETIRRILGSDLGHLQPIEPPSTTDDPQC